MGAPYNLSTSRALREGARGRTADAALRPDVGACPLSCPRCRQRSGADPLSVEVDQGPGALRARRFDRRGGPPLCRAVATQLRPRCLRRKQARRFRDHCDRGDGPSQARWAHADDRQHLHQWIDADPAREKDEDRLRARRPNHHPAGRRARLFSRHDDELPAHRVRRLSSLCQGASRQSALRERRDRQLSADQHRNSRQARRSRSRAHSLQGRRRRDHPRSRQWRHPCVVVQHHQSRWDDEGRPRARARHRGRAAASAAS
jgi:hypothetical protein